MSIRVLVTGSRDWPFPEVIGEKLSKFLNYPGFTIVHGACPTGADKQADEWAIANNVSIERYPAKWDEFGKRAGFLRNKEMVDTRPDFCYAFILNGSKGATNCADLAKAKGIPTKRIEATSA